MLAGSIPAADFSGDRALEYTRRAVSFGPRVVNSAASKNLREWLKRNLARMSCQIVEGRFTAATPHGPVPMENVIARFRGKSGKAVAITGHYDTKQLPGIRFAGANDGGSSTGLLLELAAALAGRPLADDVYLVWFDGEEALVEWSATDGLYGSRHLAERWRGDGTLSRLKALINVDMIGDRGLEILQEANSTAWLRELIWRTAVRSGHGGAFGSGYGAIEDDHIPFLRAGVAACDLIDFSYGPGNAYWHTAEDTMDKLSGKSLETVGRVLTAVIGELGKR